MGATCQAGQTNYGVVKLPLTVKTDYKYIQCAQCGAQKGLFSLLILQPAQRVRQHDVG